EEPCGFARAGPCRYGLAHRRRAVVLTGLGLLTAGSRDALPPQMTIEQVVTELAPPLVPGASVEGPSAAAVKRTTLQPGYTAGCGAIRDAIATPPGTAVRLHLDVPRDGVLRFSVGVDGDKQRHPDRGGARLPGTADGGEAVAPGITPATRPGRRRGVRAC